MAKTEVKIDKNFGQLNFIDNLRTNPSCIGSVVNELAKLPLDTYYSDFGALIPFEIEEKISYNDLKTNKHLVEDYGLYERILSDVYDTVEAYQPNAKNKIWKRLRNEYRRLRAELLTTEKVEGTTEIEIIREYSDYLIDKVKDYLNSFITNSHNLDSSVSEEDIASCIEIIIGDAFVNCKILENPNVSK